MKKGNLLTTSLESCSPILGGHFEHTDGKKMARYGRTTAIYESVSFRIRVYSQVPNKRVGPNKRIGWLF